MFSIEDFWIGGGVGMLFAAGCGLLKDTYRKDAISVSLFLISLGVVIKIIT